MSELRTLNYIQGFEQKAFQPGKQVGLLSAYGQLAGLQGSSRQPSSLVRKTAFFPPTASLQAFRVRAGSLPAWYARRPSFRLRPACGPSGFDKAAFQPGEQVGFLSTNGQLVGLQGLTRQPSNLVSRSAFFPPTASLRVFRKHLISGMVRSANLLA
jgi:hypothetical protein